MFITLLLDVDSVVDSHTISHAFSHISECSVQHRHIPPKSNDYPLLVNCRVKLTGTPSHTTHVSIWVRYFGAKQISPTLAYVERGNLSGGIFTSTRLLARLMGDDMNIHNNMFHYINMVETKLVAATDGTARDGFEVNTNNILKVTEEHLNDV